MKYLFIFLAGVLIAFGGAKLSEHFLCRKDGVKVLDKVKTSKK